MPIVYLEPGDLNVVQAQQVLDFLNRASNAQQLGRDIEFPGEPDIGVKLGQRLLDARAALGGRYTAIMQVRAVRLIGPERFTEICVAALGLDPRRWVELFYGGSPAGLQAETGLAVAIDALPQPAWLGQPLTLTVRVADHGGTPRAGVAVTVQAGAGRLAWMFGFQRIEGQAVTVLTGADGSAVLELRRDASEPPTESQDAVLQAVLQSLDAGAADPFKLEADFRALADLYLRERAYALRGAIDIHVREHRDAMLDGINPGTWRMRWPVESVLVQADAVVAGGGGSALARAVTTVQWKNWVGAWLEFFGDALRETAALDDRFDKALSGRTGNGAVVLGGLLDEAQRFVANQSGRTALWLGQKTVDAAVNKLVASDRLANVDDETRAALLTQLEVASREISPTSLGNFTLVRKVRTDLGGKLLDIGTLNLERLTRAELLLAEVDRKEAFVDARAAEVERKSAQFDAGLARFDADVANFNRNTVVINTRLESLSNNVTTLRNDFNRFQVSRGARTPRPRAKAAKSAVTAKTTQRTKAAKKGGSGT
jgi:hypothetical protein